MAFEPRSPTFAKYGGERQPLLDYKQNEETVVGIAGSLEIPDEAEPHVVEELKTLLKLVYPVRTPLVLGSRRRWTRCVPRHYPGVSWADFPAELVLRELLAVHGARPGGVEAGAELLAVDAAWCTVRFPVRIGAQGTAGPEHHEAAGGDRSDGQHREHRDGIRADVPHVDGF
ncbi:hypothetical protein ON010_g12266 [Phytophthora cinnamomi]|nr:hypothetical protein ON010_g12266 [Phytophthora cinnamomi]